MQLELRLLHAQLDLIEQQAFREQLGQQIVVESILESTSIASGSSEAPSVDMILSKAKRASPNEQKYSLGHSEFKNFELQEGQTSGVDEVQWKRRR